MKKSDKQKSGNTRELAKRQARERKRILAILDNYVEAPTRENLAFIESVFAGWIEGRLRAMILDGDKRRIQDIVNATGMQYLRVWRFARELRAQKEGR